MLTDVRRSEKLSFRTLTLLIIFLSFPRSDISNIFPTWVCRSGHPHSISPPTLSWWSLDCPRYEKLTFETLALAYLAARFLCRLTFPAKHFFGSIDRGISQVGLLQRWEDSDPIALDLTGTDLQLQHYPLFGLLSL